MSKNFGKTLIKYSLNFSKPQNKTKFLLRTINTYKIKNRRGNNILNSLNCNCENNKIEIPIYKDPNVVLFGSGIILVLTATINSIKIFLNIFK